jgi:hypothetical protein
VYEKELEFQFKEGNFWALNLMTTQNLELLLQSKPKGINEVH